MYKSREWMDTYMDVSLQTNHGYSTRGLIDCVVQIIANLYQHLFDLTNERGPICIYNIQLDDMIAKTIDMHLYGLGTYFVECFNMANRGTETEYRSSHVVNLLKSMESFRVLSRRTYNAKCMLAALKFHMNRGDRIECGKWIISEKFITSIPSDAVIVPLHREIAMYNMYKNLRCKLYNNRNYQAIVRAWRLHRYDYAQQLLARSTVETVKKLLLCKPRIKFIVNRKSHNWRLIGWTLNSMIAIFDNVIVTIPELTGLTGRDYFVDREKRKDLNDSSIRSPDTLRNMCIISIPDILPDVTWNKDWQIPPRLIKEIATRDLDATMFHHIRHRKDFVTNKVIVE